MPTYALKKKSSQKKFKNTPCSNNLPSITCLAAQLQSRSHLKFISRCAIMPLPPPGNSAKEGCQEGTSQTPPHGPQAPRLCSRRALGFPGTTTGSLLSTPHFWVLQGLNPFNQHNHRPESFLPNQGSSRRYLCVPAAFTLRSRLINH